MFTGLIADMGSVRECEVGAQGARLAIDTALAPELQAGDSIAVSGVCLTAAEVRDGGFVADAMAETLARSTLGSLRAGSAVNLELPLRASERLGGHVVQGHVDGTGVVAELREEGFARVLEVEADARLLRYLVLKGSVALDGVSLTVSALGQHSFAVSLIPETLRRTTLAQAQPGARLNIEVDVLAKHLERLLAPHLGALAA